MEKPFEKLTNQNSASANARLGAPVPSAAERTGVSMNSIQLSNAVHTADAPRTVIRGESPIKERDKSRAALTDWLNISFPFHLENNNPKDFFTTFSDATNRVFGGMTDQEHGLHGWKHSFKFDHGCVMFAYCQRQLNSDPLFR